MLPIDFDTLETITNLIFNAAKFNGSRLEAQEVALKIMKELNL